MSDIPRDLPSPIAGRRAVDAAAAAAAAAAHLPPTTTAEQSRRAVADEAEAERTKEGQRRINLIWETTQAVVALAVTVSTLYVAASLAMKENGETAAFLLLSNVFFLVVGTYFNRTNHTKTGGVGRNDTGR